MAQSFKVGDIVQLRSGGPLMTVTQIGEDMGGVMTVWCVWFSGQIRSEGSFPMEALALSN